MSSDVISKIREWYKPINYSCVKDFNIQQVVESLGVRASLHKMLDECGDISRVHNFRDILKGGIEELAGDWNGIFRIEDGIVDEEYNAVEPITCEQVPLMLSELYEKNWLPPNTDDLAVQGTPLGNFLSERCLLPSGEPGSYVWGIAFDDFLMSSESEDESRRFAKVSIDLAASDRQILDEIKLLLPMFREKLRSPEFDPNTKEGKSAGWRNWVDRFKENRILDLIDIQLWARYTDTKMGPSLISKVVYFDRSTGGDDDVRKTYLPMAKEALNPRRIEALRLEAGREFRKQ